MRRLDVVSTHHSRPPGVACFFQVAEQPVSSENAEARRVFNADDIGSTGCDKPIELMPEPGAGAVESSLVLSCGCSTDVLTREAACPERSIVGPAGQPGGVGP